MRPIRAKYVPLFLAHAASRGVSVDAICDELEIPRGLRSLADWSPTSPALPLDRIEALVDRLARELADPWLGLRVAREIEPGTFGVVEHSLRNSATLRDAAERLLRLQTLTNDAIAWEFTIAGDVGRLVHRVPGRGTGGLGAQLNEYSLAIAMRSVRALIGEQIAARRVRFAHARRQVDALAAYFLTDRIELEHEHNEIELPAAIWDRPIPGADPSLSALLDDYAARLAPPAAPDAPWSVRLRAHLRASLREQAPSLEQAARELGVAARFLQRRLAESGTSFRDVLDEARRAEALRAIGTDIALDELAVALGYSDLRAFTRAFHRWTGQTPSHHRRALRGGTSGPP